MAELKYYMGCGKVMRLFGNKKVIEFIRYSIVGTLATGIQYICYCLLHKWGMELNLSYTVGYVVSFMFNFIASNYFTFKTQMSINRGAKFALAHLNNYIIQILLLNIYLYIGINKTIAPIFVFILAGPINFFVVRFALRGKKVNEIKLNRKNNKRINKFKEIA